MNRDGRSKGEARQPAPLGLVLLLILPVLVHLGLLWRDVTRFQDFQFDRLDFLCLAGVVAYLSLCAIVVRNRSHAISVGLVTWSLLLTVAAIEVGAYATGLRTTGLPWPPMRVVSEVSDATMPGVSGETHFTTNRLGLRAASIWPRRREDRILCVGGSATECFYVTDEQSWPWVLGEKLTAALGRPILVANAGKSGQFSLNHSYLLRHYRYARRFGTIILLCGMNDAGTCLRNNYEERSRHIPEETLYMPAGHGAYYRQLYTTGLFYRYRDARTNPETRVMQDPGGHWYAEQRVSRQRLLETNTISNLPPKLTEALARYRRNLIGIIRLCRESRQQLVLVTQPTIYDENMPAELTRLLWQHAETGASTPEALARVMAAYNGMLKDVSREQGVECVDADSLMAKDTTVFYDDCHFNVAGCSALAAILTDRLLPILDRGR